MTYGAYWEGLPGAVGFMRGKGGAEALPCVYRRARGVDASVSTISFPRSLFTDAVVPLVSGTAPFALTEGAAPDLGSWNGPGVPFGAKKTARPAFVGDLWLVQQIDEKLQPVQVVARQLYFVESVLDQTDFETPLVVVTLADIRRFWDGHGSITKRWNVPLGSSDSDLVETLSSALTIGTQAPPQAEPGARRFEADTAKNGGRDPVPLREIVQDLLNELPGRLQIVRWPSRIGEGEDAPHVRCWAANPKEALRGLLDAYRLAFDPGPDLKARVFKSGEGTIGVLLPGDAENLSSFEPITRAGPWADLVVADGNRYSQRPTHAPRDVEVLGDRAIMEAAADFCTPVLTYELEEKDKPPRTIVLEVTPANLAALARGVRKPGQPSLPSENVLPSPRDQHVIGRLLGAIASPLPPIALKPPGTSEVKAAPVAPDPFVWQRLALQDAAVWKATLPWVTEGTRQLLQDQLWRRWQVPKHLRRLLPLLRRAQRDFRGERLEIQVEAFSFKPQAIQYRDEAEAVARKAEREEQVASLKMLREEIALLEARRRKLEAPEVEEVARAAANYFDEAIEHNRERLGLAPTIASRFATVGYAVFWPFADVELPAFSTEDAALNKGVDALKQAGRSWIKTLFGEKGSARRAFADSSPGGLLLVDPLATELGEGATTEEVAATLARIDARIADYKARATKLENELNPTLARTRKIGDLEAALATQRAETGEEDPIVRAEIGQLMKQQAKEFSEFAERAKNDVKTKTRFAYQNLSRQTVPFRVVDEGLGIIETTGDLPCWLADTTVEDARSSFVLPMPVRITFGTLNRLEPDGSTGGGITNPYMVQAAAMLASMPGVRAFAGPIGHILPVFSGESQLRLTFTRGGPETGEAPVGPFPYRLTVDEDPPLRELVTLGGFSNRAELLERVMPHVRALLSLPLETDAGSLVLSGVQTVGCNGRISMVETRLEDVGTGFVTEVSFGVDVAPLPGVLGRRIDRGPLRLVFGIDVEATRNR